MDHAERMHLPQKTIWIASAAAPALLWLSQPPIRLWPLAMVALVPWIFLAARLAATGHRLSKRDYVILYLPAVIYWLLSLQGLRLAHPLMFIPWTVFGLYLAVYHVAFVVILERIYHGRVPLMISAPVVWVGLECIRNYLATGISVLMLGHHVVDVPHLIQIADLFGTYGVSYLIVMINVAIWMLAEGIRGRRFTKPAIASYAVALLSMVVTLCYGQYRLTETLGEDLATFALIQRSEPIEYDHSLEHELTIFKNYARQTALAAAEADKTIDAVVWPESMFTAGSPWRFADDNATTPEGFDGSRQEFLDLIRVHQSRFTDRARYVQSAFAKQQQDSPPPQLLVGCGVIHYWQQTDVFSGFIHVNSNGTLEDWYGKTHLVMFGEYIPIAPYVPLLKSLVPPGMGIKVEPGAKRFLVGDTAVAPNICIETAVERVTVNHLASFDDDSIPDVVVTITNDGWFDDSTVIEHHLVCAQLLAVGCRRPILSAANSGPTASITSNGRIANRLAVGASGAVIATPNRDSRISPYLRIGDWPARICLIAMLGMVLIKPSSAGKP